MPAVTNGDFHPIDGELIGERRLAEAKKLLETTDFTKTEIAAMCGFRERAYFSARFRRRFGLPPTHWRESHTDGAKQHDLPGFSSSPQKK